MKFRTLSPFCDELEFAGAFDVEKTDAGAVAWRLPMARRALYWPAMAVNARVPAGVRIATVTDAAALQLVGSFANKDGDAVALDLLIDGKLFKTVRTGPKRDALIDFGKLPAGVKLAEIYLPTLGETSVKAIRADAGAKFFAWRDTRPKFLVYGSSITQCRRADSPSVAWPAYVANRMGWNLTCMGFGGQCLFDPVVCEAIRERPADVIMLCLGINSYCNAYNERTWRAATLGVMRAAREGHPHARIIVVSPVICHKRETTPGQTGMTLRLMRRWLKASVAELRRGGDRGIEYLDGLKILGRSDGDCLCDGIHPSPRSILLMGRRFVSQLSRK